MIGEQKSKEITTKDLSEIPLSTDEEKLWIQELSSRLQAESMTIRLVKERNENEQIIEFRNGKWYAGRYVGDISYKGRTLHITPRYEASFYRWISRIWGVKLIDSQGAINRSSQWVWEFIAILWGQQLVQAAKHGLPFSRIDEIYSGPMLRGKLKVGPTLRELDKGRNSLVSQTTTKVIDPVIGSILLQAYQRIRKELGSHDDRSWLSDRGKELLGKLQQLFPLHGKRQSALLKQPIRYTPILESYRPIVQLSLGLLNQKPIGSSSEGNQDVFGTLLDMAEVWELYIYRLIQTYIVELDIQHTGRQKEASGHLFTNAEGRKLGALKPDIILQTPTTKQVIAIVDAKYKHTFASSSKPTGLERGDLYQIHAYMDAFSTQGQPICGILVYPDEKLGRIRDYQVGNPWQSISMNSSLRFYGISGEMEEGTEDRFFITPSEEKFIQDLRSKLTLQWTK